MASIHTRKTTRGRRKMQREGRVIPAETKGQANRYVANKELREKIINGKLKVATISNPIIQEKKW